MQHSRDCSIWIANVTLKATALSAVVKPPFRGHIRLEECSNKSVARRALGRRVTHVQVSCTCVEANVANRLCKGIAATSRTHARYSSGVLQARSFAPPRKHITMANLSMSQTGEQSSAQYPHFLRRSPSFATTADAPSPRQSPTTSRRSSVGSDRRPSAASNKSPAASRDRGLSPLCNRDKRTCLVKMCPFNGIKQSSTHNLDKHMHHHYHPSARPRDTTVYKCHCCEIWLIAKHLKNHAGRDANIPL